MPKGNSLRMGETLAASNFNRSNLGGNLTRITRIQLGCCLRGFLCQHIGG